jgi:hypothetical protein
VDTFQVVMAVGAAVFAFMMFGTGVALAKQALEMPGSPRPVPCALCDAPVEPGARCPACAWAPELVDVVGKPAFDGYRAAVQARRDFARADRLRATPGGAGAVEADAAEQRATDAVRGLLAEFGDLVDIDGSSADLRPAALALEAALQAPLRAAAARRGDRARSDG